MGLCKHPCQEFQSQQCFRPLQFSAPSALLVSGSIARSSAGLETGIFLLSLFWSSDFIVSECVIRSKLLDCAFLAICSSVKTVSFTLQDFIPWDTKSSICLPPFGSAVAWELEYLNLLVCTCPNKVSCVSVTNGPVVYLSGLLYEELFFPPAFSYTFCGSYSLPTEY